MNNPMEITENLIETRHKQSRDLEPALRIRNGIAQHFVEALNADCLFEVTLTNKRRADIMALSPSGEIWIVEVKSSHADFRSDQKWTDYLEFCDRYWFATNERFDPDLLASTRTVAGLGPVGSDPLPRPSRPEQADDPDRSGAAPMLPIFEDAYSSASMVMIGDVSVSP